MNEPAIKKYFAKALKYGHVFIGGLQDGKIAISDSSCLLILEPSSPVFESRVMWPKLPARRKNYHYLDGTEQENAPNMIAKVDEFTKGANTELIYSRWNSTFYDGKNNLMFLTEDKKPVSISEVYINLIGSAYYKFYGSGWNKPVVVKAQGKMIAVVMPVMLPDEKFPTVASWED